MINTKAFEVLKQIAIILLLVLFSLSSMVACGSGLEGVAGSRGGGYRESPDGTEPVDPTNPEQPAFDESTYYKVYAPGVKGVSVEEGCVTNVSYQDTNKLTQIWKDFIDGGRDNDGKRWFIRDANNNQKAPLAGSYYYFDKDFNVVYYRQGKGSLTVRKFINGIIVKYNAGKGAGTLAIGGIYETVLSKNEITDNNFDQLNIFMGDRDMKVSKGNLEVLVMNTGYNFDNDSEFGVDFYMNKNFVGNVEEFTSRNPEELYSFLNGRRNLSWKPEYVNFKFVSAEPQAWHLEDHLNRQGWH